jgi:hypothetical protein
MPLKGTAAGIVKQLLIFIYLFSCKRVWLNSQLNARMMRLHLIVFPSKKKGIVEMCYFVRVHTCTHSIHVIPHALALFCTMLCNMHDSYSKV